jgi:ATP-dependent Lhr-like helicase
VRRGYFVEGLSGRQFALAGAVERLREVRGEAERSAGLGGSSTAEIDVLAALDPANPYGAVLPWPEGRAASGPRPRRVAGAWVILAEGEAVGFVESGLRSVVTFRPAFGHLGVRSACEVLTAGLREVMRRERKRSLRIGKVDGADAATVEIAAELGVSGWQKEELGWRVGV